jgi:hypothetical protein
MSKEIALTHEKVAIVDDDDYERLNQWKWSANELYALRYSRKGCNGETIFMHKVILNSPDGMEVDHINRNGLDNRKCNLRICNHSQNEANKGLRRDNTSGVKGVYWNKRYSKWHARIRLNNGRIHIGYYDNIEDATDAYQSKSKELFGEFAEINRLSISAGDRDIPGSDIGNMSPNEEK